MGPLQTAIDEYNAQKKATAPAEVLDAMAKATKELEAAGIVDGALRAGDTMPDFSLPNQHGEVRQLSDYYGRSALILNVYRGGWCPYCNFEMKALADVLPEIRAAGAALIGMSPETPDKATEISSRHQIDIEILHDAGNRVSEQLGLVFELPEALRSIYQARGIDIPAYNGDDSFKLPVPATYIIGDGGQIRSAFVNADYTQRLEPSLLLEHV